MVADRMGGGGTGVHAPDMEERDPGLARERTELAWTRTAISFAAVGAAVLRSNPAVGAAVIAMSTAIWVVGRLSARNDRHTRGPSSPTTRRGTLQLITAATTLVSLAALAIAVFSHGRPIG